MSGNRETAISIISFLEAPENCHLFNKCPVRNYLSCLSELDDVAANNIVVHILGHILDYRAGEVRDLGAGQSVKAISQENIDGELRYVYNDCNNVALNEARKAQVDLGSEDRPEYREFGPEQRGCFGVDAQAELMAEAFRAYMQDPNYLKSVAPNVAARIRAAVNPNPALNRVIQFN